MALSLLLPGGISEAFGLGILGLTIPVSSPALALLVPNELVATFMATLLAGVVSAVLLLLVISGVALWAVSRVSICAASAAEGARAQGDEH